MSPRPIKFVTSFSDEGYKKYGKTMLESFLKHWPGSIDIYIEGNPNKKDFVSKNNPRVHYKNLLKIPGSSQVLAALSCFSMTKGYFRADMPMNYKYNAYKFVRKIFAQCVAGTDFDGYLFWIDADTIIDAPLTENYFRMMFEGGEFMVYLGRPTWHTCASFVGWNMAHEQNESFWMTYFDLIVSGRFLLLPEWHDSFLLDIVREQGQFSGRDLCLDVEINKGPDNVFDKVFAGKARHFKGSLKDRRGPQRYSQLMEIVNELQPKLVIEIGTWNGLRALEMKMNAPDMKYVGFDLFEHATPETDEKEKNVKQHFTADQVGTVLSQNGLESELVVGDTNLSFPGWLRDNQDRKADLIYIDGGHSVETIRNDFNNALKASKPGTVIVFDDYYEEMPDEDLCKWGANQVLAESGRPYEVLPIADPVNGGGVTKMAVVRIQ